MDFSRKNKNKKKNPSKVYGLPKLETLSQEQREQLCEKNFQELAALRSKVYSSLNIWPGKTYLPAKQTASAPDGSAQHQPQQQNQTNGATIKEHHQPPQIKHQGGMGKQRLEQKPPQISQKLKQQHHQDSKRRVQQFQKGSKVLQNGSDNRSEDFAEETGSPKDLSENKNYLNTSPLTSNSSLGAVAQERVPPKPERFVTVDESSDFDYSSLLDLDTDSSDFERF
ncbi:hypothetical protein RRG08_044582 [Elysia crispata]|uniref:Uncharacterized protein n=1 Tax=Elysia crispata TaxID=231223 RepID=A0AAE1DMF7_9GAST|nr:hypothetical protein RRG08_044582 [Elysia crispata]